MLKLLRADAYHMFCKKWFMLCSLGMMALAVLFCILQATAMDYVVALDRVIFLPTSFIGVAVAALVAIVSGEDFSDGVVRNKIISGADKASVYLSHLIVNAAACLAVYLVTTLLAYGLGLNLFENNVPVGKFLAFLGLGALTCIAYASSFTMITMLIGSKATAVAVSMGIAFIMLFLGIYTNAVLAAPQYKDGVLNPRYLDNEALRRVYEWVHDINPTGQMAQLSQMNCNSPVRYVSAAVLSALLTTLLGCLIFRRKDIK